METDYLDELVARLRDCIGGELVGVYAGGSYALGDYDRRTSDLDVTTVTRRRTPRTRAEKIVAAVRHEALPCPARGLELVLYPLATARSGKVEPGFDLNLNTGPGVPPRVDFEPVEGEGHWFAIDRSVLAAHGIALFGPPAAAIFVSPARVELLPLLAGTLRWFLRAGDVGDAAMLNACRSLRYGREGVWSSKPAAGDWARLQGLEPRPDAPFLESVIAELERG